MKMLKNKKGNTFKMFSQLALSVALISIILITTFLIMSQGRTQIAEVEGLNADAVTNATECAKSLSCNATIDLQMAVDDIPDWIPLVVIVGIGMAMIALVGTFARVRG